MAQPLSSVLWSSGSVNSTCNHMRLGLSTSSKKHLRLVNAVSWGHRFLWRGWTSETQPVGESVNPAIRHTHIILIHGGTLVPYIYKAIFWGYIRWNLGLKNRPYMVGTSNLGSWNSHWLFLHWSPTDLYWYPTANEPQGSSPHTLACQTLIGKLR